METSNAAIDRESGMYVLKENTRRMAKIVAVLMSLFHFVTASIGSLPTMQQRSVHLAFALILIFLQSAFKKESKPIVYIINIIMSTLSVACCIYVLMNWLGMSMRVAMPRDLDLIVGTITVIAVLYATYLKLGIAMPAVAGVLSYMGL